MPEPDRRFSIAPMMDCTTPDFRYFARGLTRNALLYTEMVTTGALIHGDRSRFLRHDPQEYPLALQLGGSDPTELAECARFAEQWGFSEVNLNVGCPSDRVQNNMMGACLMAYPERVARAVAAMNEATSLPVTVKHRIGIDGHDSWEALTDFVGQVADAGCRTFIAHARIAILEGLSPKQNRDIPPLRYEIVHRLKQTFPELEIVLNGGIQSLSQARDQLQHVDGVMVGREAYHRPWMLTEVDPMLYGQPAPVTASCRHQAVDRLLPYIEQRLSEGAPLQAITRHIMNIFHGCPGGRRFRRHLSENAHRKGADSQTLREALSLVAPPESLSA